ncbi:MAG: ATP-binding protein [Fulvivirga sp.]|nr:ATP-binding protein [Fulvivirga sp.]
MTFYKKFSFKVATRVVLILLNLLLIATIFGDDRLFFNQIILSIILILQVGEMLRFINKTNRELSKFILAIRHKDFSINFSKHKIGSSFDLLNESFEEIISEYKQAKIEKEAQYRYLQNVVEHINVGIIALEGAKITLMNSTAEKLIGSKGILNWHILKEKSNAFARAIEEMGDEGQRLIEMGSTQHARTLAVDVSSLNLLEKKYKLVTFKDIQTEIEQKEIEAWHKLIRILTHEIMNSATPISSLTETMQMMLDKKNEIDKEVLQDLRFSLQTIQKRSDGMLAFIDDYRKITRVPKPKSARVHLTQMIKEIAALVQPDLDKAGITLKTKMEQGLFAQIDKKLIEQVLINLIQNAKYALEGIENPEIAISVFSSDQHTIIEVSDNGKGIAKNELKEIFVPFYTTRKEGSGIGLSLSKQIMHLHQGQIKVESQPGKGTTFTLVFRQ